MLEELADSIADLVGHGRSGTRQGRPEQWMDNIQNSGKTHGMPIAVMEERSGDRKNWDQDVIRNVESDVTSSFRKPKGMIFSIHFGAWVIGELKEGTLLDMLRDYW